MISIKYLVVGLAVLTLSSCSIYHPQAVDIPLIDHPGDIRIDVAASISSSFDMPLNGTFTYGINNWLAGQAHFNVSDHMICGQLAAGAYKTFGEHNVIEGYVGYNAGYVFPKDCSIEDSNISDNYRYEGNFTVPFGQINIGWKNLTRAHIDLGVGLKVGSFIPNIDYREYDSHGNELIQYSMHYNTGRLLIEPQFIFRIGGERFKWCFKGHFSSIDGYNNMRNLYYDTFIFSIGLNMSFGGTNAHVPIKINNGYDDFDE